MITRLKIEVKGKVNKKEYKFIEALNRRLHKELKTETEIHFKDSVPASYDKFRKANGYK